MGKHAPDRCHREFDAERTSGEIEPVEHWRSHNHYQRHIIGWPSIVRLPESYPGE